MNKEFNKILSDSGNIRKLVDVIFECAGNPEQDMNEALLVFSESGQIALVKLLLASKKCNVNCKSLYGATPLMFAIIGGHLDMVKLLIQNGADTNISLEDATDSLYLAFMINRKRFITLFSIQIIK